MIDGLSLTPRQTRTALDLLTGAVIVSVAFALAGLTWRIAGHAGTGAITVPSGNSAPSGTADVASAIALAPFGKAATGDASQPTSLPLELRGVVAAQPASLSTAFIAVKGQDPVSYHIGENVGGATLQSVLRDRVILSNGGRLEFLAFPDSSATPAQAPPPGSNPVAGAANAVPPPPQAPPQSASALIQRFGATQAQGGYRVGANAPAGLNPGDVLLAINGSALSDPNAAGAAFAAAQASGSATILILRNGNRLTLTVPLR